jgi:hypothetical protein
VKDVLKIMELPSCFIFYKKIASENCAYFLTSGCHEQFQDSTVEKHTIYKTIILVVVLYGCETCSMTLREVFEMVMFKNRVLRRIFGPKKDEVTGWWRKLHNEELRDL